MTIATSPTPYPTRLDPLDRLRIRATGLVCHASIRRWEQGLPIRPSVRERIERAMRRLHITPRPAPTTESTSTPAPAEGA